MAYHRHIQCEAINIRNTSIKIEFSMLRILFSATLIPKNVLGPCTSIMVKLIIYHYQLYQLRTGERVQFNTYLRIR